MSVSSQTRGEVPIVRQMFQSAAKKSATGHRISRLGAIAGPAPGSALRHNRTDTHDG